MKVHYSKLFIEVFGLKFCSNDAQNIFLHYRFLIKPKIYYSEGEKFIAGNTDKISPSIFQD